MCTNKKQTASKIKWIEKSKVTGEGRERGRGGGGKGCNVSYFLAATSEYFDKLRKC